MAGKQMDRKLKFTIWHGLIASLIVHSALGSPFVAYSLVLPDDPPTLVIELEGVVSDRQTDQKVQQDTKSEAKQSVAQPPQPPSPPQMTQAAAAPSPPQDAPKEMDEEGVPPPKPATPQTAPLTTPTAAPASSPAANHKSDPTGLNNKEGAEIEQHAQTIDAKKEKEESARLMKYVTALTKKIQNNMIYHDDGRRAAGTVSFVILSDGQVRPDSLRMDQSSGQQQLDNEAMKTVQLSAPFPPPPREMRVAINLDFDRKR